ncbi:unnamed protein product [Parnassius apollo]|uniref:(apollo) hypothetical protein n=1 Tax=Parnassius apollo TaxID=110799 RepID=A0A8S3Y786_PARAO|nr:unnamed protein product [Parnassius apollo]
MSLSQEERIRNWLEEDSDEDVIGREDDEEGGDEIEPQIREHETDTEEECDSEPEAITENQNIGSSSEDDVPLSHLQTSQCYVVHRKLRNGRTEVIYRWRMEDLPGPKAICRVSATAEKAWILLFSKEWLEKVVLYTNQKIQSQKFNYQRNRDSSETDMIEIRALIGLLYLIGLYKSSHVRISDVFNPDGTGLDICRAVMSVQRFKFLLRNLRFDDRNTRDE